MVQTRSYPRVSVVIPALNEARNLPAILPNVDNVAHEVILVDGHSTDGTVETARAILPHIKVVYQTGKGKGDALRCGFAACNGDIIVMIDADGSTDPLEIPSFIEALVGGADMAKGSRCLASGGSDDITWLRWLGNRALNGMVSRMFQSAFTDLCYGYIAFWRDCLEFFEVDCQGFEVEAQIILRARKANLKIVEVPSYEYSRIHGASHLNTFRDGWRVLKMIGAEWRSGFTTIKTPGMHHVAIVSRTHSPVRTIELPSLSEREEALVSSGRHMGVSR